MHQTLLFTPFGYDTVTTRLIGLLTQNDQTAVPSTDFNGNPCSLSIRLPILRIILKVESNS
jgi:hypothetical protein